jgi:predicted membrane GTPase involved in stress response
MEGEQQNYAEMKPLSEQLVRRAEAMSAKAEEQLAVQVADGDATEHFANAALALMQTGALAHQYERQNAAERAQAPEAVMEALTAYRDLARSLESQFRGGGSDVSRRVADRIKAVIDLHG